MSEPIYVDRIQSALKAFRVYCDCGDVTGAYDEVCHHDAEAAESIALALTLATQRAEAAEAKYGVANECHEYALRLYKETLAERDALRKVDDAMVERAVDAYDDVAMKSSTTSLCSFKAMQAALDAALAVQPSPSAETTT